MPLVEAIKIEGLAQLNRSLRQLDGQAPVALRLAGNEAARIVVDAARPMVPRQTGRAASTVRAASTRTSTRVSAGGKRAPYFPWLDYGGRVGRGKKTKRPFLSDGRYIYPAFRANRDQFERVLGDALRRVITDAGLDVT